MSNVRGLYIISVAAQILEMHPQTLRKYERAGFIVPPRMGTLRLYSEADITRLRLIKHLVEDLGLNLSGVELALDLTTKLLALRSKLGARAGQGPPDTETLRDIDDMLLKMGFRVADEGAPRPGSAPEREPPRERRGRVRIPQVLSLRER